MKRSLRSAIASAQRAVGKLFVLARRGGMGARSQAEEARLLSGFLTGFLALAVWTLAFDIVGGSDGWHHAAYVLWVSFRARCIAPAIRAMTFLFMAIFVVQSMDKVMLGLGCLWIKLCRIRPRIEGGRSGPRAAGTEMECPMVLVQIPMCNEIEVYKQSISAACNLDWPSDRLLIQVLDDSSDESTQSSIEAEVSRWKQSGMNIVYRHRLVRSGYKAGNLKSAMSCDYVKDYEFVAIFDADFQPSPDYLKRTIPHFKDNPRLGLVQARWALLNRETNLLTRLQYINMCYHFEVEQQVTGAFLGFFGFNGTAGVWRIRALEESGGWMERTTVEDMDIAVRAHFAGWRFLFLNDVKVLCEVPDSYDAYRKQQQRWNSGPMHLFRLCLVDILESKLPTWNKGYLVLLFFLVRKMIVPCYSFLVLCILLPLTMFVPEVELPLWFVYYVPFLISLLNVLPSARSLPLLIPYFLFEHTISATKFGSVMAGAFQPGGSYEWVVTKKSGRTFCQQPNSSGEEQMKATDMMNRLQQQQGGDVQKKKQRKSGRRIYGKELTLGLIMLTAALRSLLSAPRIHFYFLVAQGAAFLVVGLGLVGEPMS